MENQTLRRGGVLRAKRLIFNPFDPSAMPATLVYDPQTYMYTLIRMFVCVHLY